MPVMIAIGSFGLIAYLTGNILFSEYLNIQYMPGSGELAIVCGAVIGAGIGFLWYNAPPAMIFMGDTGSLSLGSIIGIIAVITKHELVLLIIGGLFVLEATSVIVQVISFRLTGKRIFKMAPLHHHFEQKGWSEPTIVIRFWIISLILALVGLLTLKLDKIEDKMIPLTHCKNKKIFVLGLGLSGESAIRALEAGGANVSAWDDNDRVRKNYFEQGKIITNPKEISVEDLDVLFLSPGIDIKKSPQKKIH